SSRWWHGPVTVYGEWPDQPAHVVPFFTSMMDARQVKRAADIAARKSLSATPLRVLFSGRLAPEKRVDALLEAVKLVSERGVELEVAIVGDGSERQRLEALAEQFGISERVQFVGALPFDEGLTWYEWAHCLVLPSLNSEGWPKVIAEGMCHGLLCIGVEHGQVPAMLRGRGILLKTGTAQEIASTLHEIALSPVKFEPVMRRASEWSRQYSLEGLRDALSDLLSRRWNVPLDKQASFGERPNVPAKAER
ncbi:MAG: glycosyltransferase, partial [Pyrinomonadaceae bacterium]